MLFSIFGNFQEMPTISKVENFQVTPQFSSNFYAIMWHVCQNQEYHVDLQFIILPNGTFLRVNIIILMSTYPHIPARPPIFQEGVKNYQSSKQPLLVATQVTNLVSQGRS